MKKTITCSLVSVIDTVETMLSQRQKNYACSTLGEEANFFCGALAVMHLLLDEDADKLESAPPTWILLTLSGRSVNGFKYKEEEQ